MRLILFLQVLSEATEDNLIDLGPGSPAVVSNMPNAAPTSLHPTIAGGPSSPATLASRLAGLGMHTLPQTLTKCSHSSSRSAYCNWLQLQLSKIMLLLMLQNVCLIKNGCHELVVFRDKFMATPTWVDLLN